MKIEFNEAEHTYKIDGVPVPSATQIIRETVGTGWHAEDWYLTRGRAIHRCAEFIAAGKDFKFDERLEGYIFALRKFFAEVKPEIIGSEIRIGSKIYGYAGTLDLLCKIGNRKVIIDWKHSIDKIRLPIQIGAYAVAERETNMIEYCFGAGVQIRENGTYSMTELYSLAIPAREFLALRTVYRIKEQCGELSTQKEIKNGYGN